MEIILKRIKSASLTEEILSLTQRKSYTVGRKSCNDIQLNSDTVSRKHCMFHHTTDGLFVEILKGSSGMRINNKSQKGGALVKLKNGDVLVIGPTFSYQVEIKPLPQPVNPEQSEFHSDVKPDLSECEINAVTSGHQNFDIKRELKENSLSDESPQKADKLTVTETCWEALARVSMTNAFELQENSRPISDLRPSLESRIQELTPFIEEAFGNLISLSYPTSSLDNRIENIRPFLERHFEDSRFQFPDFENAIQTGTHIPIEFGPQSEFPELEVNSGTQRVKIENPDIPVTNLTIFATPEERIPELISYQNSELPTREKTLEILSNQSFLSEISERPRPQTPDLEEGMQIEIVESDIKPDLTLLQRNSSDDLSLERQLEQICNSSEIKTETTDPVLGEAPLLIIRTALGIRENNETDPVAVLHLRNTSDNRLNLLADQSNLGVGIKEEAQDPVNTSEFEIIPKEVIDQVSLETRIKEENFHESEVEIIGELRKNQSRRQRNSRSNFETIKQEPQSDEVDINRPVKQEKECPVADSQLQNPPSFSIENSLNSRNNVELRVKEERPDLEIPNQPTAYPLDYSELVFDNDEFHKEKAGLSRYENYNTSQSLARRTSFENFDLPLPTSQRIKVENSDCQSLDNSVDSQATTDTESTNVVVKTEVVEAENVPEIGPIIDNQASTSSEANLREENLEISRDLDIAESLEKTQRFKKSENRKKAKERKKGRREVTSEEVVISTKVQNEVPYRAIDKERTAVNFKESDKKREKNRNKEDKGKEAKKMKSRGLKSKEGKTKEEKTEEGKGEKRKREETRKKKAEEKKEKKCHKEKESLREREVKETYKGMETSTPKNSPKLKENSKIPRKKEQKQSSIDSVSDYVGAKVLDDEDLPKERGRSFDVRDHSKSRKFRVQGKGHADQGTGFSDDKRKINFSEYNKRMTNTGPSEGSVQGTGGIENDSRFGSTRHSNIFSGPNLEKNGSQSFRNQPSFGNSNFEISSSSFKNPGITPHQLQYLGRDRVQFTGLKSEILGSVYSDPRKQRTEPLSDSRDPKYGSRRSVPGPSSSDPRKKPKREDHESLMKNGGSFKEQIVSPKAQKDKVRNSASVDPRIGRRTSESEPQLPTSGTGSREVSINKTKEKSSEATESSDLKDQLLFEIFVWGPEAFCSGEKAGLFTKFQKIESMPLNFANYKHYCKVIFNILCLDVSSRIQIGFKDAKEHAKYNECSILPDVWPKIQVKDVEHKNSYLVPFFLEINVPNSEDHVPPQVGDLLQMCVMNENKRTSLLFGYIQRIQFRGSNDTPMTLMTYLVTIKDVSFNIYKSQIQEVWNITSLKSAMESATAISQLEESPFLPSIILPNLNISPEGPRRLLRREDLIFPEPLDEDQLKAISRIIELVESKKSRVCLIEGSAGTGKTNLIYHIILKLLWKPTSNKKKEEEAEEEEEEKKSYDKPKILVCTSSNVEFEDIIEKLMAVNASENGVYMVHVNYEEEINRRIERLSLEFLVSRYIRKQQTKYHQIEGGKPVKKQAQTYEQGMKKLNEEFKQTGCKFSGLKMTVFKEFFAAVSRERTVHDLTIKQIRKIYAIGNFAYLMGANLIFCNVANLTNDSAMNLFRNEKAISLCIMDEAAQILEFEALKVLSFGIKTLVLLGDQEKKPTAKMFSELRDLREGNSLFSRLVDNFSRANRSPVIRLKIQYRMVSEIERWLIHSRIFGMHTSSNVVQLRVQFPLYALRIFNLSYTENFIQDEATFASSVIKCIASFGDLRRMKRNISVGVVISNIEAKEFVEQDITNAMADVPEGRAEIIKIETNTIDGFMNREKDILLVSCLRNRDLTSPDGLQRFYSTLTRTKQCLIIFGRFTKVSKIKQNCD